jgi:hypothetical protein
MRLYSCPHRKRQTGVLLYIEKIHAILQVWMMCPEKSGHVILFQRGS